jgi:hypothetical protein
MLILCRRIGRIIEIAYAENKAQHLVKGGTKKMPAVIIDNISDLVLFSLKSRDYDTCLQVVGDEHRR